MAPNKKIAPYVHVMPQGVARIDTLENHVSNNAAAKLVEPKAKGKGVGKGYNLRQARRKCAELATISTEHIIWDGCKATDGGH